MQRKWEDCGEMKSIWLRHRISKSNWDYYHDVKPIELRQEKAIIRYQLREEGASKRIGNKQIRDIDKILDLMRRGKIPKGKFGLGE